MDSLISFISNTEVLTPQGIIEIFTLFIIVEFIGILFSWVRGERR